ncbi:MAG: prolyl-tRNA synthetase associated domain-containing protein [Tissierellia bacterium]|nr:prolyl-tRNA synthetase associated domain-containing protein [Tissierellia bacterium]
MNSLRKEVIDVMDSMKIQYDITEHPPVYTIEEMDKLNIDIYNQVVKNLFVRDDKKKKYYLIVLQKDKKVNLKEVRNQLNCRPLTFASEEDLNKYMGLSKGSVSPFGILNDTDCRVEVIFDKSVLSFERIGVHPNDNTATVWINPKDLELIINSHGNRISYINI